MKKTWVFLVCFVFSAFALFGQNASDFKTEVKDGKVTIIGYTGTVKDVRIPDKINGLPVTAIGGHFDDGVFESKQLTSVTIPNSITSIGEYAFYFNDLTSVTIPNSVTSIGGRAFDSGVNVVQNGRVVYGTQEGFSYTLMNGTISIWSYTGTAKDVRIPDRIIGLPVTNIGGFSIEYYVGAFSEDQLTSVTIPNSVTTIGKDAFSWNKLTSVTIPNSVTSIGENAFSENQLTSVTISNSVTTIGNGAFSWNKLTSVTIPNSVISIGSYAFFDNQLTSVTIPNSVTSIGGSAFDSGVNVVQNGRVVYGTQEGFSYTLMNGTITIWGYSGTVKDVRIPDKINGLPVTTIGEWAFSGNQLTSVTIPNTVTSIGERAFYGNKLTSVTIPNSVTSIKSGAFESNQLTSVTIPKSVTSIDDEAFDSSVKIIRE
ncbi:MAG: leucine-rich repeat domain-containing protein [Treponema sp.]|nr:leucine-rich repeat domain-containing protein [Treponema sp.]